MSDLLAALDRIRPTQEPLTIEGALLAGLPPLLEMPEAEARRHVRLLRLAREYMIDFDLVRASARAEIPWDWVKTADRDPLFISICRGLMEEMKPEDVVTRSEILLMLKREATTAGKATDRINAINHLARLAGMELKEDNGKGGAPTINITLTQNGGETPEINVTHTADAKELL